MKYPDDFINKIICNNNLEVMSGIPDVSVDLIYGDILYGTGKNYGDYQDLKPIKKIIDEFYISRIKEMYRVLKETGSIYLQMDWRINHWIRLILDDIFGYDNFRNEIVWDYNHPTVSNAEKFLRSHDLILYYNKSKNYTFNPVYEDYISPRKRATIELGFNVACRGNGSKDLYVYDKNKIGHLNLDDYKKVKYVESRGNRCSDIFHIDMVNSSWGNERVGYPNQKPKKLLKRIIIASSNEHDLIADFFCGSGTSCVVAKELNRNYIGVDTSERACRIAEERLL